MVRVLSALLAVVSLVTAGGATVNRAATSDVSRAQSAFAALQRMFGTTDGSGLYRERYPRSSSGSKYSYEWPFSQVHVAVLDLAGLPGRAGRSYDHALTSADAAQMHYWSANAPGGLPGFTSSATPPYGQGHTLFYDDNNWVGLEAIQDYAQRQDKPALLLAEKIFVLAVSGWDNNRSHPRPGGVFWMQARGKNNDRNTVSTMPAAELGFRLYQLTKQEYYLTWADRMYRWTNRNLQRSDGMFYDHVDLKGRIDRSLWSYNQGVAIAANLAEYRIARNRAFLREAKRIASATYQYLIVGRRLDSQPLPFNAILFKQLLVLESLTGGTKYRAAMQSYADWLWRNVRNPRTGLFRLERSGSTDVIEQAAATQIYAMLAWPSRALAKVA